MNLEEIQINKISSTETPYDLLLLSDDTIEAIDKNLNNGEVFTAKINKEIVGAFILKTIEEGTIEIKNIAISENKQGMGIGTILLNFIISLSHQRKLNNLIVGTCDLCTKEIEFYKKSGFKIFAIKENFFITNYEKPIYEKGQQIRDMIMLSIDLNNYPYSKVIN